MLFFTTLCVKLQSNAVSLIVNNTHHINILYKNTIKQIIEDMKLMFKQVSLRDFKSKSSQ